MVAVGTGPLSLLKMITVSSNIDVRLSADVMLRTVLSR